MIKKSLALLTVASAFLMHAQDVSVIKNTAGIYSETSLPGSAKYNAMAGAMGALGGDVSVINTNPAGIGVAIASDMSGTLSITNSKNTTAIGNSSLDYSVKNTDLGQIGGIAAFEVSRNSPWKFVNIGVNYSNRSIEDYSETPTLSGISVVGNDTSTNTYNFSVNRHAYDRTGNQSKMSVGIGGNYDNRIYVGAGLNFHSADITQYDTAELTDGNTSASFYKQYTPFSEQSTGFSANIGVIGKVSSQFRLGAALETPTWWTINRTYSYYDETNSEDRKLSSPMKATLSAAFVPNKNFALNVDYTLGLTKPKYKVYGDAETELNDFFSSNGKNVSEVRAGAEYRIQGFRLRAGYGFASNPLGAISVASSGSNASYDDLMASKRNTLGVGIGYDFKSFYIDAAYQNVTSQYHDPFLYGISTDGSGNGYIYNDYATTSNSYVIPK